MAGKVTETNSASTKMESSKPSGVSRPAVATRNKDVGIIERVKRYVHEVIVELKKTTWPTKPELINSTKVVIGLVVVVGIYLAVVDWALTGITQLVNLPR
jgi:preprotein translocase subunit SecE